MPPAPPRSGAPAQRRQAPGPSGFDTSAHTPANLTAFGYAVSRTRLLPRWTGRSAYVLAGINVVFVPSLFFGNTPADFYAANGWGTTALVGAVLSYWLLALGISLYRSAGTPVPTR